MLTHKSIIQISFPERMRIRKANRGMLSEVTRELGVSAGLVSRVFWRKKNQGPISTRVEMALLLKIEEIQERDLLAAQVDSEAAPMQAGSETAA